MHEEKRFTLRMDGELFEKVKKSAIKNRRSVAKEIEFILFQYTGSHPSETFDCRFVPIEVDGKPLHEDDLLE